VSKRLFSLRKKCNTHVGTIATMAPEILDGEGKNEYNYKCDLWSIGIIVYRLLFKESPYHGLTENAILNKIKKLGTHNLKKTKNKELDNLIQRLLEKNPKKRLDWDEYLNHSFFKQSKEEDNKNLNYSNNYSNEFNQESEDPDVLKVVFLGEPGANTTALIRQI
jgi:serine/threonine protein kinase